MAYRHMNVKIGTEAALFPEKEYINGIFLAVWSALVILLDKAALNVSCTWPFILG